jgi:threonine/homoserine/homoserine lactone efflux protein
MKYLKNILVGFVVSFVGSIPLGYLNVIGFDIFNHTGLRSLIPYLLGVISVEVFVIYFTLVFAEQLMNNKKLLKYIEGFSVLFMLLLAYIFYASATNTEAQSTVLTEHQNRTPYFVGIFLSALNFVQIPFWVGWNLYLLNGNWIAIDGTKKYFYVFGTLIGTFFGMLALILSLHFLTSQTDFFAKYLMRIIIPLVFVGLGVYQGIQFWRKYFCKGLRK